MKIRTVSLTVAIIVSLVFTVQPELAIFLCNAVIKHIRADLILEHAAAEPISRFFSVLSPILVGFLSFEIGQKVEAARARRFTPPPVRFKINPTGLLEPYRSIVLYTKLPSFADYNAALQHLEKSVVLSNHKLIAVTDEERLDEILADQSVVGVIMDTQFRQDALRRARRGVSVYIAQPARSHGATMGHPVTLRIGGDMLDVPNIYRTALPLAKAFIPDVAKSVGFHGTWATTYGILAITEDFKGHAGGVYWYGWGIISDGLVEVDTAENIITMRFKWDQTSNNSGAGAVGSHNRGEGEFRMPAGSDVFFGYWYQALNPDHVQLWSGTRLSSDIIQNIRSGGVFYQNFGLQQHSRRHIVDPEA